MTIKRQIFISNVYAIIVTLAGLFLVGPATRFIMVGIMGINFEDEPAMREEARMEMEYEDRGFHPLGGLIFIIFFVTFISVMGLPAANKEYELLHFLASNSETVFCKERLYDRIWGEDMYGYIITVAVHINRLREKPRKIPQTPVTYNAWGAAIASQADLGVYSRMLIAYLFPLSPYTHLQ
jgi:hypothetical protein